jgi:hypothetical protein
MSKKNILQNLSHSEVFRRCKVELDDKGFFSKDDVLEKTKCLDVADSIRWDILRTLLEETLEAELIPVVQTFFPRGMASIVKSHGRSETVEFSAVNFPEKFIATGNGKKTAGYVMASAKTANIVIRALEYRKSVAVGNIERFKRSRDGAILKGVAIPASLSAITSEGN